MTFFLIVPSVMIVGVFLVHGVFNRLGLKMHFGALVICAVLSVAADVGAAMLSTAPDKSYFMNLGGMILGAAFIATLTNYFLVKKKIAAEKIDAETRAAYLEDFAERIERAEEIKTVEKIPEPVVRPKVSLIKKPQPKKILKPISKVKPFEPAKIEDKIKLEAAKEVVPIKKVEPVKKVESPKILETTAEGKTVKKFEPEKISRPVAESKKIPAQTKLSDPVKKTSTQEKIFEPVKKTSMQEKISEPVKKISTQIKTSTTSETLDDILELAYSEKSQGHTWQAIAAYQKALEKYRGDDYAPFVAIDLGNVYKEMAMYAKAIKTFEDALELPAVKRNAKTTADFKKNIVYLRTVQSVLLRHQALTTPFSRISKIYLREIETEFQSMQTDLS